MSEDRISLSEDGTILKYQGDFAEQLFLLDELGIDGAKKKCPIVGYILSLMIELVSRRWGNSTMIISVDRKVKNVVFFNVTRKDIYESGKS